MVKYMMDLEQYVYNPPPKKLGARLSDPLKKFWVVILAILEWVA